MALELALGIQVLILVAAAVMVYFDIRHKHTWVEEGRVFVPKALEKVETGKIHSERLAEQILSMLDDRTSIRFRCVCGDVRERILTGNHCNDKEV